MNRLIWRLEITQPPNWTTPQVGEHFYWVEQEVTKRYGDDTSVVCILESIEDIRIPAATDQIRRSPGGLNYVCLGTTDNYAWVRPQFDDHRTAHMIIERQDFETWEFVR